jgi:hypothetical protein
MKKAWVSTVLAALMVLLGASAAMAAEQTELCGRVNAYARPTATAPGSVTIGTRTAGIAAGVTPSTDPQPTATMCVRGELNASGAFTSLTVAPYIPPYPHCGPVVSFRPATATAAGEIVQAQDGVRYTLVIPAGLELTAGSDRGYRCFNQELTVSGDLVVAGVQPLPSGFRTPPASVGRLPSTAADSEATPAIQERTGSTDNVPYVGLIAAIAAAVLMAVAVPIARRRKT